MKREHLIVGGLLVAAFVALWATGGITTIVEEVKRSWFWAAACLLLLAYIYYMRTKKHEDTLTDPLVILAGVYSYPNSMLRKCPWTLDELISGVVDWATNKNKEVLIYLNLDSQSYTFHALNVPPPYDSLHTPVIGFYKGYHSFDEIQKRSVKSINIMNLAEFQKTKKAITEATQDAEENGEGGI